MPNTASQKKFYGNDNMPNGLTTAYTCPASTVATITCITLVNKTSSPVTATIKAGGVTINPTKAIDANGALYLDLKVIVNATETITVQASAASAIAVTINGVEVV